MTFLAVLDRINSGLPWLLAGIAVGVAIASRKVFGDSSWRKEDGTR
jgi:hypothetical protein